MKETSIRGAAMQRRNCGGEHEGMAKKLQGEAAREQLQQPWKAPRKVAENGFS